MRVVILGAGGHGKVVCDAVLSMRVPPSDLIGFVDDNPEMVGRTVMGLPVLRGLNELDLDRSVRVALGIGDNGARRRQFERAVALGYEPLTVVHATAVIGRGCTLGRGVVVFANAVVNPDSHIEDDVILNTACSVDHDCRIGAHAHIAPGARLAGGVTVGSETLVGIGSVVLLYKTIGSRTVVGAGAAVTSDLESDAVAVGVPARIIKRKGAAGTWRNR
jgi:sugar O-acyltransferase (sialic acid O-acetyltransferase NeuD family)